MSKLKTWYATQGLQAATAYSAALRGLGFGFPAFLDLHAYAGMTTPPPDLPTPPLATPPQLAFVDSMASLWIVHSLSMLNSVTNASPGFSINTANGSATVQAVGTALVYLRVGRDWECYEVPNVLVLPSSYRGDSCARPLTLASTPMSST